MEVLESWNYNHWTHYQKLHRTVVTDLFRKKNILNSLLLSSSTVCCYHRFKIKNMLLSNLSKSWVIGKYQENWPSLAVVRVGSFLWIPCCPLVQSAAVVRDSFIVAHFKRHQLRQPDPETERFGDRPKFNNKDPLGIIYLFSIQNFNFILWSLRSSIQEES